MPQTHMASSIDLTLSNSQTLEVQIFFSLYRGTLKNNFFLRNISFRFTLLSTFLTNFSVNVRHYFLIFKRPHPYDHTPNLMTTILYVEPRQQIVMLLKLLSKKTLYESYCVSDFSTRITPPHPSRLQKHKILYL